MNQREKALIGIAVAVTVVIGGTMLADSLGAAGSTDRKIRQLQTDRRDKETAAKRLVENVKRMEPQVDALAWDVTPDQLRQEIVRRVLSVSQTAGVTVVNYRPLKPRPLDVLTEVSVDYNLTGTLPNLVKMLYPLQQPNSRLSVDRIRIAATNTESDVLNVALTVSGYTSRVPAEVKVADTGRTP